MRLFYLIVFLGLAVLAGTAQTAWESRLDSEVRFYQTTDFGILLAGTDRSLYALDGRDGQRLWRRGDRGLDETSVTPIPGTDLILVSLEEGKKSRLEAIDLLTGRSLWQSGRVKGEVLQLAVEPAADLLAVVLVIKGYGEIGREFKREPVVHVLRLSDGVELWKHQLESDVELMPARFDREKGARVAHTLDNYRAPLILDGRLFLFYEGVTSFDASTGAAGEREEFTINEDALALTDADPVFDEKHIYISGRGKVRAIERRTGRVVWQADDLGVTPELAVVGQALYVRTGGQFTSIRDGRLKKHGPYGISALDTRTGERLWRYKGADKGLTNFVFSDVNTILIADRDDLITLNAQTGELLGRTEHNIKDAQFILINEPGEAVIGGREQIAGFSILDFRLPILDSKETGRQPIQNPKSKIQNRMLWSVRHKPPDRGVLRIIAGIALRATALYFRYGGMATGALNLFRGAGLARTILSSRWSGLTARFSSLDLTTLAANAVRDRIMATVYVFGMAARNPQFIGRILGLPTDRPDLSGIIRGRIMRAATPSAEDVREGLLERLDPVKQAERLSEYFLKRKRLSEFRGKYMYFYTELPDGQTGLIGVNIHTGRDERFIRVNAPDIRFTTDEINGRLYSADGRRLMSFVIDHSMSLIIDH